MYCRYNRIIAAHIVIVHAVSIISFIVIEREALFIFPVPFIIIEEVPCRVTTFTVGRLHEQ